MLWTQLCDDKLRPYREKLVPMSLIHSLPTCVHFLTGETSVDLYAAEDKNGSSGSETRKFQAAKKAAR
jgi:hypothetical protein